MDSEHGHMHDPIEVVDVESLDSDGDSKFIHNEDDTEHDAFNDETTSKQQENYIILNEKDIFRLQDEDIKRISTVLTISKVSASILLQHYNWSVSSVHDAWFADEEKVRTEVGLLKRPVLEIPNTVKELDCGICFESYGRDKLNAAACGHPFCISCWTCYISTSITDGAGCLMLRCPEPSCRAAVGQDMIDMLASDENKQKYSRYLLRSYIENNREIKWCPAPGCDYAVDFVVDSTNNYDVSCHCKYEFCWNCTEEAHRPVDCNTVAKWIFKNNDESENTNWILANSKPCPKCSRPIEKNQGCMHMTCSYPCRFQFCWLCLGPIKNHGNRACNGFLEAKGDETKRREMAKKSIERYTHYYERWAANHSSREKAVADLKLMQSVHIEKLRDRQCQTMAQLNFITEAWVQIIECRRVLKWTYAYGYYLPEHEVTKKQFFEYLQGEAETGLERLHHCAEKELQGYLNSNVPSKDFNEFRSKLSGLTTVTRNYFENLVHALENGLSDVKSQKGACSESGSSKNLGGTAGRDGRGKGTMSRSSGRVEEQVGSSKNLGGTTGRDGRGKGTMSRSSGRVEEQVGRGRGTMSRSSGPWPVEERVGWWRGEEQVGRGRVTMSRSSDPWPVEERVGWWQGEEQFGRGRVAMSRSSDPWPVEERVGRWGVQEQVGRGRGATSRSSGSWPVEEPVVAQVEEDSDWFCEHCTFANYNNTTPDCQMCNLPRYFER